MLALETQYHVEVYDERDLIGVLQRLQKDDAEMLWVVHIRNKAVIGIEAVREVNKPVDVLAGAVLQKADQIVIYTKKNLPRFSVILESLQAAGEVLGIRVTRML
jgi:hypothetical protein